MTIMMQPMSANRSTASLSKVSESLRKIYDENEGTKGLRVLPLPRTKLNISADVVVVLKDLNNVWVGAVMLLSEGLKDKQRRRGTKEDPYTLPAVPSDICANVKFRQVTKLAICKELGIKEEEAKNKLILCLPQATPIHLDLADENNLYGLASKMYNHIAFHVNSSMSSNGVSLSFPKVERADDREKLAINVMYNTSEETQTDEWGFDVRADVLVKLGKIESTNDDLSDQSSHEYGRCAAYFDALYYPQQLPGANAGWNMNSADVPKTHYLARLMLRMFEGPDGHSTIAHDLVALAGATAITQDTRSVLYSYYPEYSLPKDAISLKNVGALAADVAVTPSGKAEFIRTQNKAFTQEMYTELMSRLFSQRVIVSQYLCPFGPRANTHSVWYEAAVGGSTEAGKRANARIIKEANELTGGNFPVAKWEGKSIYRENSTTVLFDGEWHNPITKRWEDLAKLQDSVAMANLLIGSNPNAGQTELEMYREFAELLLPNKGNFARLFKLKEMLVQVTGGPQAKGLRINDLAYAPILNVEFLNDLQAAMNKVVNVKLHVTAPTVTEAQKRGQSVIDLGSAGFNLGSGTSTFGGGTDSPWGDGFSSNWGTNNGW